MGEVLAGPITAKPLKKPPIATKPRRARQGKLPPLPSPTSHLRALAALSQGTLRAQHIVDASNLAAASGQDPVISKL